MSKTGQFLSLLSPLLYDSGRAKAAFISLSPRPKKTATPWTRAAACSPASRRWCTTTALSVCLSTAPSTWPCYTQCLASTHSTPARLRYTKQTRLWANMDKTFPKKVTSPVTFDRCVLLCPFSASLTLQPALNYFLFDHQKILAAHSVSGYCWYCLDILFCLYFTLMCSRCETSKLLLLHVNKGEAQLRWWGTFNGQLLFGTKTQTQMWCFNYPMWLNLTFSLLKVVWYEVKLISLCLSFSLWWMCWYTTPTCQQFPSFFKIDGW